MSNPDKTSVGIHVYVYAYIESMGDLSGKTVLDIPSGDGRATNIFKKQGANVISLDIFPRKGKTYSSKYGDMTESLDIDDNAIDIIICQEGIEHVPDQYNLLKEFNRILKKGGDLILTTPNISNIRSKISCLFTESDMWKRMPCTEIDSIWHIDEQSKKFYFGHLFLIPVNHLKTLLTINGFHEIIYKKTRISKSSVLMGLFIYPFFLISNILAFFSYTKKNQHINMSIKKKILWQRCLLNLSFTTLFRKHIFWVCKKNFDHDDVIEDINKMQEKMSEDIVSEREIIKK
ncbi:MAG: methyltransferase domain-containing protein [Gammaproteobacteria bacterium]|nr:methyltransferase domain-containing protein [Gammaproteobacteria bacterium]